MFSKPITFIVGAGASSELNFPTGLQLKAKIAEALNFHFNGGSQTKGDPKLFRFIGNQFGSDSHKYINSGYALVNAVDSFVSIDEALHYVSKQPEAVTLGKAAIVYEILNAERKSSLFNSSDPANAKTDNVSGSWLPAFFSMVIASLTYETIDRAFADVTLIDFNYDRSIEFYLLAALQKKAGLSSETAKKIVSEINIIKPYGSLGSLEAMRNGASFGEDIGHDNTRLFAISNSICTYTEQNMSSSLRQSIYTALEKSHAVVFLGFGFHDQNIKLLQTDNASSQRQVFATVKGINVRNYEFLMRKIKSTLRIQTQEPVFVDCTAHQLLAELRTSIVGAAN